MNADRLREIQAALERDFAAEPVAPCEAKRVHLVYAHLAEVVDATNLLPQSFPDFGVPVDAWKWPTVTAYEECGVVRSNQPYRDFIRARFLWKERPGVELKELPTNATTPPATAADGGTLIPISDGPRLGPTGTDPVSVSVTLPAAPATPAGYPTIRRVCISTPGETGGHAELDDGVNTATVVYPQRDRDNLLHLVGEMPWFRFSVNGTDVTADPWAYRIGYGVTTASDSGGSVIETSTSTTVGPIHRNGTHYGLDQRGGDTKTDILNAFAAELSPSRRLAIAGVLYAEGGPSAVSTHDGPKASWGMNQWTWPRDAADGELHQILCFIYDFFPVAFDRCFGRYGIGVSFESRRRSWRPAAYNSVRLFRVSCCKLTATGSTDEISRSIRAGLDALGEHLDVGEAHNAISGAFNLLSRADTMSVAFLYLLFKAGHDADVQKAQVQWTSYRIGYGFARYGGTTNDDALSGFLRSLGSNMPAAERLAHANEGIAAGTALGQAYPPLTAAFSDEGTTEEWRDWAVRCDNAGKTTTPAATAPLVAPIPLPRPVRPGEAVPAQ